MMQDFYGGDDEEQDAPSFVNPKHAPTDRATRVRVWIIVALAAVGIFAYLGEKYAVFVEPGLNKLLVEQDMRSVRALEDEVRKILDGYGIADGWVKLRIVSLPGADSVRDEWSVMVPADVPVASITNDLNRLAEQYDGKASSVENAKTGQVSVHIRFREVVRYSLVFTPTAGIKRREGRVVVLVDGLADAPDAEVDAFIDSKDPVGAILIPARDIFPLYERIRVKKKDIVLHLHFFAEKPDDNQLALAETMAAQEIAKKVKNVCKGFAASGHYFITSEHAPGENVRVADAEGARQGFARIEASSLSYVDRTSEPSSMSSRMNDLASSAIRYGTAIGVLKLEDGTMEFLHQEMIRLRKKGMDFISITQVLPRKPA